MFFTGVQFYVLYRKNTGFPPEVMVSLHLLVVFCIRFVNIRFQFNKMKILDKHHHARNYELAETCVV